MNKPVTTSIFWSCIVLSVVAFVYAIGIGLQIRGENRTLMDEGLQSARRLAADAQTEIAATLKFAADRTDETAEKLFSQGKPGTPELLAAIRILMYSEPGFVEAGVAFAPFAYDAQIRLYGFSYVVNEDGMRFHDLDAKQDYTRFGTDWYHRPMQGTEVWLEPRYDEERHQMLVTYAVPLFNPQRSTEPVGVIFATYAVNRFQRVLDAMHLGANGYAFLLSSKQRFVLHPNSEYIQNHRTLDEFRGRLITTQPSAVDAIDEALQDPSRTVSFRNADLGLDSLTFFQPIPPAAWRLGVVLINRDLLMPPSTARPKQIRFALLLAFAVVLMTVPLSRALHDPVRGLWILSGVFSVCCVFAYGATLRLSMDQAVLDATDSLPITNRNVLNQFMSDQRRRTLAQREELPLFIPTGIYIQSMDFENGRDVEITGYIWQRYTDGIHDIVERGFEMVENESFDRQEPQTTRIGDTDLVRWSFKATLPQQFDYSRYPFGNYNVAVRLWHKQFTGHIILIPDLESYALLNPAAGPGLLDGLTLAGWNINGSFFSYRFESYQTSFGLTDYAGLTDFPELIFNIGIEQEITESMVSHILPLAVVFILVFAILFMTSRSWHSETGVEVVVACATFFIVVVFSHIGLRESLATRDIVYLEYFYFTTYVMILYVTLNDVIMTGASTKGEREISTGVTQMSPLARVVFYRNNLIPKLIFWPASQLILLVLTLLVFN